MRSSPDELDFRAFRYLKNVRVNTKNKLCRMPGFDKAFTVESGYNNGDLRDQLLSKSGMVARAPITFLYESISTRKSTKLIAGTSQVLFAHNSGTGNWKIISDQFGTADTRWRAAQLEDTVIFSNNFDALVYWQFDQGITEANNQSVAPIPQLVEIEITRAGVVVHWMGHIFLMNVTISGAVRSHGIYWCNYNRPLDWQPSESSTAGNADLDSGETILAALPLSNRLLVYTNKGIWEGIAVGGEEVFQFSKRYSPQDGEACLFYPNTLVSIGGEHIYGAEDGLYVYSLFADKPKRTEWIHKASEAMYGNINRDLCEVHVAGYDTEHKEVYFSYATGENTLPNETLMVNTEYPFSAVIDHGFSALTTFIYRGAQTIVRDFLIDNCICDSTGIDAFDDFTKEGGSICGSGIRLSEEGEIRLTEEGVEREVEDVSETFPECPTPPNSIYTTVTRTETDGAESVVVEDWDEASALADSLCDQLDGITLNELCEAESRADECNSGKRFIAASTTDYCLKEFSENYYREICTDFTECGVYELEGYKSLLRSGPIHGGNSEDEKKWRRFEVEASHVDQVTPSQFRLRIGHHSQAIDPNDDGCGIIWNYQDDKSIDCLGGNTAVGHASAGTRPAETYSWPIYYVGSYLYFELSIENEDVDPIDTGGESCISRISVNMEPVKRRRI